MLGVNFFNNSGRKIAKGCQRDFGSFADNRQVNLNEPIIFDNAALFCKTGSLLAMRFLVAARDAVMLAGAGVPQDVVWRVEVALAAMLIHRAKCRECEAVEFLAQAG
jgi:hypothetical protein